MFIAIVLVSNLEYAISKIQKIKEKSQLNGTHHLLVYADDGNLTPMKPIVVWIVTYL